MAHDNTEHTATLPTELENVELADLEDYEANFDEYAAVLAARYDMDVEVLSTQDAHGFALINVRVTNHPNHADATLRVLVQDPDRNDNPVRVTREQNGCAGANNGKIYENVETPDMVLSSACMELAKTEMLAKIEQWGGQ